ncbi:MAG: hypothetical protein PVF73_11100 [Bacteroidales bacterium]|jgi:hypothetical protein
MKNDRSNERMGKQEIGLNGHTGNIATLNNLDYSNAVSFIGNENNSTFDLLYKVKITINLLFNNEVFMELIKHSVVKNEIGGKYILGNTMLHNFIITAAIGMEENEKSYVVVLKCIPKIAYLDTEPGTIQRITLKRLKINKLEWSNKAEISFKNTNGHEYIMKISFFNRN